MSIIVLEGVTNIGGLYYPVYRSDDVITEPGTIPKMVSKIISASDVWAYYLRDSVYMSMLADNPNYYTLPTGYYSTDLTFKDNDLQYYHYLHNQNLKTELELCPIPGNGTYYGEVGRVTNSVSNYYYAGGDNFVSSTTSPCLYHYVYNGIDYIMVRGLSLKYYYQSTVAELNDNCIITIVENSNLPKDFGYSSNVPYILSTSGIDIIPVGSIKDPFGPGGNSEEGDNPPGTFDKTSDTIPDSPLPTLSMADTGFTRIYNPTLTQVQNLAEYMWKTENIFETLWNKVKQSFENPMDVMIAFNIVPVAVPDGGTVDFSIMYIPTGVELTRAANQFVDVDCGTLDLKGYYGSALDYSPNTRIQCFLPFIGMIELNPDEVMNTTLQIKYRVDIVSGGCVAKIFIDGNCLYQYSGHCSVSVPFTASDFSSYMNAMLQVSALAVGAIAAGTGAALAAAGAGEAEAIAQQTSRTTKHTVQTKTVRNPDTGRQITAGTITTHQTIDRPVEQEGTEASFNGLSPQNIFNTASAVMASKAGISHAGSFNGNTGYLGVRYPFLIITTPRQCLPSSFQTMNGYPSMITLPLSECTGYTRVQQVQLSGMTATNPEQAEILQLLKGGVIL